MAEFYVIFVFILEMLITGIFIVAGAKWVIIKVKGRKLSVKTPKMRGRNVLRDEIEFGSAKVVGYTPVGAGYSYLDLIGNDGIRFRKRVHTSELYPENPVQAVAGAEASIWRLRAKNYKDRIFDDERISLERQNLEMKENMITTQVESKIRVNESANLPDQIQELIKESQKSKAEGLRVLK